MCDGRRPTWGLRSGVKTIESRAFEECSNLWLITLPSTVTKLGSGAFGKINKHACVHSNNSYGFDALKGLTVRNPQTGSPCYGEHTPHPAAYTDLNFALRECEGRQHSLSES